MTSFLIVRWLVLGLVLLSWPAAQARAGEGLPLLSPEQQAWVAAHPTIVLGVYDSGWPPYERVRGGRPEGLGPDYLHALAQRLGLRLRVRTYPGWSQLLDAACRGEIDVVMNVSLTAERTRCMVFTDEYAKAPIAVVGRRGSAGDGRDTGLANLRIATEAGFLSGEMARAYYPGARHLQARDTLDALAMVADGRADVFLGNAYVAQQLIGEHGLERLSLLRPSALAPESLHFGVPNAKQPLAEALDAALAELDAEQRRRIEARWLEPLRWTDRRQLALAPAEAAVLAKHLRLGFATQWAPISFLDEDGKASGLASEYLERLRGIGARLERTHAGSWQDIRRQMLDGKVDAVMGVPTDSRFPEGTWVYSKPFLSVPNVIVTRMDGRAVLSLADLQGRTLVLSDPERIGRYVRDRAPEARIVPAPDARTALELLAEGKADAYVGNLAAADQLVRRHYPGRLNIAAPAGFDDHLALAVRREYAPLASAFDRLLVSMSPREREAIRSDWLAVEYRNGVDWRRIARWAIPLALVLLTAGVVHGLGHVRLRREVAVRRAVERRLAEVTDNLPAVVYQARREPDGRISFPFITGDMRSLFGLAAEEALQDERRLFARVHPDDQPRLAEAMARVAETLRPLDIEFRARSPDDWRWVRSSAQAHAASDGALLLSGYWVDVTEAHAQAEALAAAKQEAERAAAAKADFLATMSHEIRTPMSGVLGMLEVLEHTRLDGEQRTILGTMHDSAQMLRQILDDILDFSKIEAGALALAAEPVDLRRVVGNVQQMLMPLATEKGLLLHHRVDAAVAGRHLADGVRLRQILFNLVSNAIKFTDRGEVAIALEALDPQPGAQLLRLSVSDTGIGIPAEQKARLFQPFSQAHIAASRRHGGSGLGLSICRRLVDLMGGALRLESEPGRGTRVEVELALPYATAPAPDGEAQAAVPGSSGVGFAGRRVLVVEDHPTNRTLMQWRMRQLGLHGCVVEDAQAALERLATERFDAMITDCRMPGMDGYALAREIRERERRAGAARLPIIALTASALEGEAERCRDAGMDDFLAKPVALEALRACLARWLAPGADAPAAQAAALPEQPAGAPAPDRAGLVRRYGSEAVVRQMIDSLVPATREDIAALDAALAGADAQAVCDRLHRIAGGIALVDGEELAASARVLMSYIAREGLVGHAPAVRRFRSALAAYLDALAG
ncbi:ATP-binding protein [[Pseudomonas] boreopolis]|uniref:ATP-binding protein n=1 Tax=Xanthomonas boreopolis TaxID=86183 RepID=UPI003D9B6F4A